MNFNLPVLLIAALIPLIIGSIWYNPKVFGNAWMSANKLTQDELRKDFNMVKTYGLTYLFSFFIAMMVQFLVIHQFHVWSSVANEPGIMDPNSEIGKWLADYTAKYGHNFRTFKHGALHGFMGGIFLVLPTLAIIALFERKSAKYIMVNGFFWVVCLMVMGGIICQWA